MGTVPPGWWRDTRTPEKEVLMDEVKRLAAAIRATDGTLPPHAFRTNGVVGELLMLGGETEPTPLSGPAAERAPTKITFPVPPRLH